MKTNAPRKLTVLIAIILGILALVGYFVAIPFITAYVFWILLAGFVVLLAGSIFKGL